MDVCILSTKTARRLRRKRLWNVRRVFECNVAVYGRVRLLRTGCFIDAGVCRQLGQSFCDKFWRNCINNGRCVRLWPADTACANFRINHCDYLYDFILRRRMPVNKKYVKYDTLWECVYSKPLRINMYKCEICFDELIIGDAWLYSYGWGPFSCGTYQIN